MSHKLLPLLLLLKHTHLKQEKLIKSKPPLSSFESVIIFRKVDLKERVLSLEQSGFFTQLFWKEIVNPGSPIAHCVELGASQPTLGDLGGQG
jgi:hypothetical protein